MTLQRRELLDEIRGLIPAGSIREVPMFGAIAVMVDDAMAVAVRKDCSLLVRVDPAEDAQLLQEADASRAQMGAGREMGVGWVRVDLGADARRVGYWVGAAQRRRTA